MPRGRSQRRITTGLAGFGLLAILLAGIAGLAQIFLPGLAASRIRERIERYGSVSRVTVRAFPAIALLWGRLDSISIQAEQLRISERQLTSLTSEAGDVQRLDLRANRVSLTGVSMARAPIEVEDLRLEKRGGHLRIQAELSREALARVLPEGVSVKLEGTAPGAGGGVIAQVAGALFGLRAGLRVTVAPVDGALVARPEGLVGDLISVKIFSDPEIRIEGIQARESTSGYLVELTARTPES